MREPLWRKILCWGAVACFFLLPLTAFVLVIYDVLVSRQFLQPQDISNIKAFSTFQATVTALLFGLSGLNSWDRRNGGQENTHREKPEKAPSQEP